MDYWCPHSYMTKVKPTDMALTDFHRMLVLFYWIFKHISTTYLITENIDTYLLGVHESYWWKHRRGTLWTLLSSFSFLLFPRAIGRFLLVELCALCVWAHDLIGFPQFSILSGKLVSWFCLQIPYWELCWFYMYVPIWNPFLDSLLRTTSDSCSFSFAWHQSAVPILWGLLIQTFPQSLFSFFLVTMHLF